MIRIGPEFDNHKVYINFTDGYEFDALLVEKAEIYEGFVVAYGSGIDGNEYESGDMFVSKMYVKDITIVDSETLEVIGIEGSEGGDVIDRGE